MSDTTLKIDLDPKKVIQALEEMSARSKELAADIEQSLGKNAPKSVKKLEEEAEKGTNKIQSFFRNLGHRVKEDLKTAFDASGVLAGAKFAQDLGAGVKQVFEMERAFDRLNTRLGLSNKELQSFKKNVGTAVAGTGQKLEDVLPSVETFAAKGGIKSAGQLASIAESLGMVKAATGEDVGGMSESVIEILKNQGKQINDQSVKATIDAIQATRVQGAFGSAGEAAAAMEQLAPYAKQFKMSEREMGAFAAVASRGGDKGQDIMRQLMDIASKPGGMDRINAIMGQQVFNGGKLNANALGKVDMSKFGKYSQQIMEEATGLQGASGADLARFVEAFKTGTDSFAKVVRGANETVSQYETASDNLATKMDRFKENLKESAREIGSEISEGANSLMKGDMAGAASHGKEALNAAWENKGTIAAGLGLTAGVGVLAGGGLGRLLSKMPGGGMMKGAAMGQAASAMGIQPVYVTNASEIGGGLSAGGMKSLGGLGGKMGGALQIAGGAAIGAAIGEVLVQAGFADWMGDKISDMTGNKDQLLADQKSMDARSAAKVKSYNEQHGTSFTDLSQVVEAMKKGTIEGHKEANKHKPTTYTNPSAVTGRGGSH